MRMNEKYYALPKVRTLRGQLRRKGRRVNRDWHLDGCRASVKYIDNNNCNILKTQRYKGRIRVNYILPVDLVRISQGRTLYVRHRK